MKSKQQIQEFLEFLNTLKNENKKINFESFQFLLWRDNKDSLLKKSYFSVHQGDYHQLAPWEAVYTLKSNNKFIFYGSSVIKDIKILCKQFLKD